MTHFSISGVDTYWWLPIVVAFAISCFSSTGGVSGAFLILPFQVSVLGFSGPAASATNLLYNIVAIPSGVARYWREKRIVWPLAVVLILASLPGAFLGAVIRIRFLAGDAPFKVFAGLVLLYIGGRLAASLPERFRQSKSAPPRGAFVVTTRAFTWRRIEYEFNGGLHGIAAWKLFIVVLALGGVAGAYGIGGGALAAPVLVTFFRLPVHTIAGATLLSTFVSSIFGVFSYAVLVPWLGGVAPASPDWLLGLLFGLGGAVGIHTGARLQRYIPAWIIASVLAAMTLFIAVSYLVRILL